MKQTKLIHFGLTLLLQKMVTFSGKVLSSFTLFAENRLFFSGSFPCLLKTTVQNSSRKSEFNSLMLFHTSLSAVVAV